MRSAANLLDALPLLKVGGICESTHSFSAVF